MYNQRYISLDGGFNTRDLGGYQTQEGSSVKWHLLYRSDDMSTLTELGVKKAQTLEVKTIIDFRSPTEIDATSSLIQEQSSTVHHLSIDFGNLAQMLQSSHTADQQDYEQVMINVNKLLVHDAKSQYRRFFQIVSGSNNSPLLFHCTAGKDRTGFAAALLLSSLGVDKETIFEDYLLSAHYLEQKYVSMLKKKPEYAPLLTVKKEYLHAAFQEIEKEYGDVENYLVNALDVDLKKMKMLYTE